MLTELMQYAQTHPVKARVGFKPKKVKGYIWLSAQGDFQGVEVCEKGSTTDAPDIGSAANGTRYCNFLVEKAKIPLCMMENPKTDQNIPTKYAFFLTMLRAGAEYEPRFSVVADALENAQSRAAMQAGLAEEKLKGGDAIGFIVDGAKLEETDAFLPWWAEFRRMFAPAPSGELSRCLISGELTEPLATVPKVSGLLPVGGHTAGDAFLCFDKDAFQSYGLKKSANAPVSEEAMTVVNAALTELIQKAPILGGAKMVHWYAGELPGNADILECMMEGLWENDAWDGADLAPEAQDDGPHPQEEIAMQSARQLFTAIREGTRPEQLTARYYFLPLSGANGRMMVRGWDEGSCAELYCNIDQWFRDLRLARNARGELTRPPKLKVLCIRLLKPGGDPKKVFDRMDSEIPGLTVRVFNAIVHNYPLPDEVAGRVLRYIRSAILESPAEGQTESAFARETLAFQLLKAWLVRRQRQRGDTAMIGESVNSSPQTPAYCCGRLMAVYSAIQREAMPDVNVSVAERYYAAASSTPAFVIGKLAQLSQHHLPKLDGGLSVYYQKMLDGIYAAIGAQSIPTTLTLEQQTEFALGYYQQRAAMYATPEK
ncbi:MAG: type I-C CRISPR-associated protein Cas8c/Csd1 [Firmicutes bacterium]|nr:type I-C CRISPR-associated protein Cas8c/Csd1 [Bacillota bacterium]